MRMCRFCRFLLPEVCFYKTNGYKCKRCSQIARGTLNLIQFDYSIYIHDGYWYCEQCCLIKEIDQFRNSKKTCNRCQRENEYSHPEYKNRQKEYSLRYNNLHPEKRKESRRKWRVANKELLPSYVTHRRRQLKANGPIEFVTKEELLIRDNYICQLCFEAIDPDLKFPHLKSFTYEHIIPVCRGGTHTKDNLQSAHYQCNCRKNAKVL